MPPRCSFCGDEAAFGPFGAVHVCRGCSARIATLASDDSARGAFWHLDRRDEDPVMGERESDARVRPPRRALSSRDDPGDPVLEASKANLEAITAGADPELFGHLAIAYWEMGLYDDALREAGHALTKTTTDRVRSGALALLLEPPLLRREGIGRLRALLSGDRWPLD